MKAISVQQPWAELILQGRRTLELRTYAPRYRGPLAIHAAQKVKATASALYGLNPAELPRGAVLGVVDLVDVIELTEESYEATRGEHLCPGPWEPGFVGWRLARPRRLAQPVSLPGRQGLFTVDDRLLTGLQSAAPAQAPAPQGSDLRETHDPTRPFELHIEPRDENNYALTVYQWPIRANGSRPQLRRVVTLSGVNLQAVADHILEALRSEGYKTTDLSPRRKTPFHLHEETGLRLALLFLTVAPLSRLDRMEAISREVRAMPSEEAYYWYSKCTAAETAGRAQQALRVLLAAD